MLAPLMAKPQVKAAGPARARSALGRAGERVHERRMEPVHATRAAPQPGPFFPSHKAPAAAWALGQIPIHPPGRRDAPGVAKPGLAAAVAPSVPGAATGKLKVGAANDPREHEADRVAERVMRAPEPGAASAPAAPGAKPPQAGHRPDDHKPDGHKHDGHERPSEPGESHTAGGEAPAGVHETLGGSGKPLDPASRAFFEPRLGRDLASVRVHADEKAAKSASSIDAHAYTAGDHVVLGEGKTAATPEGKRVMAHELTHVAQQKGEAPTVQRFPFPHPPAPDAKQTKPKAAATPLNSYIDLFNGFQDLATDAINRGGAGLDTAQAHFGGDLSTAHRALLKRVQFVLIEAQDDQAKRLDAAQAWPGLAGQLQGAVSEARRWPELGNELAAVTDDIGMLSRSYVHAKAGKAEPEAESFGDYADSVHAMNDLLWIFGKAGEASDGLIREQVAGRKEVDTSQAVQAVNAKQRAALGEVKFGARLNARHAKVMDTLRTALLLARSEDPGSAYKALQLWRSIEGDLEHVLSRAPTYQVEFDVAGVEAEVKSASEALAAHFAAVHRESVGVALTKPRTQQEVKAERTLAKSVPALAAGVKEGHAVEDFRYALSIIEQHLTPSKDHPGEYVLTSGPTVIRVRTDQAEALHATVAKELKSYMAQLVKGMVRVWETYDSIQRGNSSFKLGLLGGFGGATDPGDQSDFKNRIIAVRDQTVYPLVDQGRFVEAFKWIMVQKDMVDRQAKEVNDYDADLDVGYSRLAIAASVVQVALMALVPVAGEAAIAGGAGLLAVGGTAVASGAGGAAYGEAFREAASGEDFDAGKIATTGYKGGVIGLGAIVPAATKSVANFIAPAGLLAPAEGTALVGANAVASVPIGGIQSKLGGGSFTEGAVGAGLGSLGGSVASKALGPAAASPVVKGLVGGTVGAGVAAATDSDPIAGFAGGVAGAVGEQVFEHATGAGPAGAKGAAIEPEPLATQRPAGEAPMLGNVEPPALEPSVEPPAAALEPPAPSTPAGTEAVPLRQAAPTDEAAIVAQNRARDRARARARPFNAKDPLARPKPAARAKTAAKPKSAPAAEVEPKAVNPEAAVPATPAKTVRRPWRPTAELELSRQRLKLAQQARDRAVAGMKDAAPGTPEFERQRARRDAADGAIADVYAQVKVDAAKFRRYQKALARWKAANPGKANQPPPELELEGYKPGPGERTTTQEEYEAARRDFRSIDPERAMAQVERALDELAGPDDPADQPVSADVDEALEGGKTANAAPGRVTQAAEAVVAEAMGSAGIKSGKKVPFYQGKTVGKDLHGRIEDLWASRPELAGIEHHVETKVGDLLPADSPIRNMSVEQFLQNRGEHLVIDQLPAGTLKSKVGNLQMDMFAKLPDGSTLIFDLTSQAEGPHLAKTLLYGLIFSEQGVATHVGETYWRSFDAKEETAVGPASTTP